MTAATPPETPTLLPCPFCGGEARITGQLVYQVNCEQCTAGRLIFESYTDAIAAWNRRSPSTGHAAKDSIGETK